jgi:hypothetical protein
VTRFIIERIGAGTYWPDAGGTPLVYTRTCAWCWRTFTTHSRRKRYCNKAHQAAYNNCNKRERHKHPAERILRSYAGKIVGKGVQI